MNRAEFHEKQRLAEEKKRIASEAEFKERLLSILNQLAQQNQATESQAARADVYHRRVENLNLRLEGRKYRLEMAETAGLWVAAFVGMMAILVASHDSENQTTVMQSQLAAMQGQLNEMKGTSSQTDQMIESNRRLAEAATKQAEAAIESVKAARDSLIASERAWVGPRSARSDGIPEKEREYPIYMDYQNSGREPAIEMAYDVLAFAFSGEDDSSGSVRNRITGFIDSCKIKWQPHSAQVVYPSTGGLGLTGYVLSTKLSATEIDDDVVSGAKSVAYAGCFSYKTVGTIHRSSFCYFFNAKTSKPANWNICAFGNGAD